MILPLNLDRFYHVYNRGNNRENLFIDNEDYTCFLHFLSRYISPVADIFAWVLMKNHFHMLIRVKSDLEIHSYKISGLENSTNQKSFYKEKWETTSEPINSSISDHSGNITIPSKTKKPNPSLHLSHFFNAYSKYYNKKYDRTGGLFERPFKRIEIDTDDYCRKLVVYIHRNPVHHGFTDDFATYKWSSYSEILSRFQQNSIHQIYIQWFDGPDNYVYVHKKEIDSELTNVGDWI